MKEPSNKKTQIVKVTKKDMDEHLVVHHVQVKHYQNSQQEHWGSLMSRLTYVFGVV